MPIKQANLGREFPVSRNSTYAWSLISNKRWHIKTNIHLILTSLKFIFSFIFPWYTYEEEVPWHLKAGHDEIHI